MSKSKRRPATTGSKPAKVGVQKPSKSSIELSADRQCMISEAAYYLAEQRGFGPGYELGDWLQAESQVDNRLSQKER